MPSDKRLAAIDLGSNSFRLEIGMVEHGTYRRTEYLKETVRQGAGLDDNGNLNAQALQAGWDCLARFGERLKTFQPDEVCAVATQTLREARNREAFLDQGQRALGFPIEVISGHEEARLIYQGVAHMLPPAQERRLVIDIGGRSTELILGQGRTPKVMESFLVGSIAWSKRFFADGQWSKKAFAAAEVAATAVLDEAFDVYHAGQWDTAYGSAGTVSAIGDVLQAAGWPQGVVTQDGLDWLQDQLITAQSVQRLRLAGIREDRKAIIGGGLSVMRSLFQLLQLRSMTMAQGGLRHGLICDMLGSAESMGDLRIRSVQRLAKKFGVDAAQATRVSQVATQLFRHLAPEAMPAEAQRSLRKLSWAAELHEIGSAISHDAYHKHGAYILDNTDAAGFSISEMHRLSLLVLGHRGKLRKVEAQWADDTFIIPLMALRLAVLLCHARRDPDLSGMLLQRPEKTHTLRLHLRPGWSETYPQSAHLLHEEAQAWEKTPWRLDVLE